VMKQYPEWAANNHPEDMFKESPDWMAFNRTEWTNKNHPDWMSKNKPDLFVSPTKKEEVKQEQITTPTPKIESKSPKFKKMNPRIQASMIHLIKDNKLKKDEVEELTGFKQSIMDHPMMSSAEFKRRVEKGIRLPRNQQQLKNAFVKNMDASNYDSPDAFAKAQARIQKMSVSDFGKLLGAIFAEEEV